MTVARPPRHRQNYVRVDDHDTFLLRILSRGGSLEGGAFAELRAWAQFSTLRHVAARYSMLCASAFGPISKPSRLESGRNPTQKIDFWPGSPIA